jgi:hypothetical protein
MSECGGCTNFETEKPKPPTPREEQAIAENILKSMNIGQCRTGSAGFTASASILGARAATSGTASFAIGCEQLALMVNRYHESKSKMVQIMNCVCRTVGNDVTSKLNITVRFVNSDIEVQGDIAVVTDSVIKLLSNSAISDEVVNEISTATKTMLDTAVDVLQKTVNDVGAPQSSQRLISDIQTNINSDSYMKNINNSVTQLMNKITNDQVINFEVIGSRVRSNAFIIKVNTLIELTANNILNTALSNLMQQEEVIEVATSIKATQEQENKGLSAAQLASLSGGAMSLWAIIGTVVVLVLLVPIVISMTRSKAGVGNIRLPWYASIKLLIGLIVLTILFITIGVVTIRMYRSFGKKILKRNDDGSVSVDAFKKFITDNELDIDATTLDANSNKILEKSELSAFNADIDKHNDTMEKRRKALKITSIVVFSVAGLCFLVSILIILLRIKYPMKIQTPSTPTPTPTPPTPQVAVQ